MWHILLCGVVKWNVRFRHSIAVTTMGSAGAHYDCHPHVIKADGTGLKKLASRNGYRGVIDFLDVYDFHDGSSDLPVWAPDSKSVFYTAKVGNNVELFRVSLDRKPEQLTATPAGSMHYHPAASPDGKWLVCIRLFH
jgi:TolB protein